MSYIPIAGYVAKAPQVADFGVASNAVQTVVNHDPEGGILHRLVIEARYNETFVDGQEAQIRVVVDGVNGDWIAIKTTGEGLFATQGFADAFRTVFSGSGDGRSLGDYRFIDLNAFYQASLKIEFQIPAAGGTPSYRIAVFRSARVA